LRLPPEWVRLREQFRIWNGYAELHLERGEWRECLELSRRILRDCEAALSADERGKIYLRLSRCAEGLGDETGQRAWRELARIGM
jgi:hypothetical protein